jgi:hypothetical protein
MNYTLQIKLSNANFPSWRTQIMAYVKAQVAYAPVEAIAVVAAPTTTEVKDLDLSLLEVAEELIFNPIRHNLQGLFANSVAKSGTLPPDAISVLTPHLLDHLLHCTNLLKHTTLRLHFLRKRTSTRILVQHTILPTTCRIWTYPLKNTLGKIRFE